MRLLTAPTAPAVTLAEAKAHLRIDGTAEDDLITSYIAAATEWMDGWTGVLGRALMAQTWEHSFDAFPPQELSLPLGPIASVTSITYVDAAGTTRTLESSAYVVDLTTIQSWIVPVSSWPATKAVPNAVTVRWVAGTGCPGPIKQAIKEYVAHMHINREGGGDKVPAGVWSKIAPWRRVGL